MRAVLAVLAILAAGSAQATECRFPGMPALKVATLDKVGEVKVEGRSYVLRLYDETLAGGPGYRDGKTWMIEGTDNGPLKNEDFILYVRLDGKQSLFIVDDRANPSVKGVCKG